MYKKIEMAVALALLTTGMVAAVVATQTLQQAQAKTNDTPGGTSGGQSFKSQGGSYDLGGKGGHSTLTCTLTCTGDVSGGAGLGTVYGGTYTGGLGGQTSCDVSGCTQVGGGSPNLS